MAISTKKTIFFILEILTVIILVILIRELLQKDMAHGQAIDFQGQNIEKQEIIFSEFIAQQDKPILLHFWATWCEICKLEHGGIDSLAKNYPVMTISTFSGEFEEVEQFVQTADWGDFWHSNTIVDNHNVLAQAYGVKAVPASFILDKKGNIHFRNRGYTSGFILGLQLWWVKITNK